jgi:hypothetical protein
MRDTFCSASSEKAGSRFQVEIIGPEIEPQVLPKLFQLVFLTPDFSQRM